MSNSETDYEITDLPNMSVEEFDKLNQSRVSREQRPLRQGTLEEINTVKAADVVVSVYKNQKYFPAIRFKASKEIVIGKSHEDAIKQAKTKYTSLLPYEHGYVNENNQWVTLMDIGRLEILRKSGRAV